MFLFKSYTSELYVKLTHIRTDRNMDRQTASPQLFIETAAMFNNMYRYLWSVEQLCHLLDPLDADPVALRLCEHALSDEVNVDGVLVSADELDDLGRDHARHAGGRGVALRSILEFISL